MVTDNRLSRVKTLKLSLSFLSLSLSLGAFGATDMNERSSRSHTIFTITVEQSQLGPDNKQHVRMGKLHLVDLAVRPYQTLHCMYMCYMFNCTS